MPPQRRLEPAGGRRAARGYDAFPQARARLVCSACGTRNRDQGRVYARASIADYNERLREKGMGMPPSPASSVGTGSRTAPPTVAQNSINTAAPQWPRLPGTVVWLGR
jgi:hypothetical protein